MCEIVDAHKKMQEKIRAITKEMRNTGIIPTERYLHRLEKKIAETFDADDSKFIIRCINFAVDDKWNRELIHRRMKGEF